MVTRQRAARIISSAPIRAQAPLGSWGGYGQRFKVTPWGPESMLTATDFSAIGLYAALVLAIGFYSGRGHQRTLDLQLGGRELPLWAVVCSMVATELSAATFIGVPHASFTGDWGYLQLACGALLGKALVGLLVVPLYYRLKDHNRV